MSEMSRDQISLLLYLETRAVDHGGKVAAEKMNVGDFAQAHRWSAEGFIEFGRVVAKDIGRSGEYWVHLSEEAWAIVQKERKARAERQWAKKDYTTTAEKRGIS